jgi:hypothetical protein
MGKLAHQRRRIGCQPPNRRMQLREAKQLERQRVAIPVDTRDVAAPHKPVEHAIELVRASLQLLGYFGLRQPAIDTGKKLENIEPLVERRCAVTVGFVSVHQHIPL